MVSHRYVEKLITVEEHSKLKCLGYQREENSLTTVTQLSCHSCA